MLALWSAEVLHAMRLRRATFESICPDDPACFEAWWLGRPVPPGVRAAILIWDPLEGVRRDRRRWVPIDGATEARPRYRDYADALAALRGAGRA